MMKNYGFLSLGAMALALFAGTASAYAAKDAEEATHDGKVVSATSSKLVMTNKDSKDVREHSHTLTTDAKVTLDGKECQAEDLKAGTRIRVTTKAGNKKIATHIEAIDKNATFADTHDGTVVSVTSSKLVMTGKDGKEHSHLVSAEAKVTCDGKACKVLELKPGTKIRVTTKKSDKGTAVVIEAIEKDGEFA